MSNLATSNDRSIAGVQLSTVNPSNLYDPVQNGYSHVIVANGGSSVAYIAGQGGEDANGSLSSEFEDQVQQAYVNLSITLEAIRAEPHQVAKISTYVVDYKQSMLHIMTKYVNKLFGKSLPAQTLVPVPRLALDGMLFEVDAIVILD